MPHIHTQPGQIDFIAEVFCVYQDKVLLRFHEKYQKWIAPGGHVELNETPEEAVVREVREEVGLDVTLWQEKSFLHQSGSELFEDLQELLPPVHMNVHRISGEHRHISMVYFGTVSSDNIVQPDNHERAECRWLTREEIEADNEIRPIIKSYALQALEVLCREVML